MRTITGRFHGSIWAMKKRIRVPIQLKNLHPGDMFHTRVPRHRIDEWLVLTDDREFELIPSDTGYFVRCTRRIPVRPALEVVK